MEKAADALDRLADAIKTGGPPADYVFDPKNDITLADVVDLLKAVGVGATSDQFLDANFPATLKRHFRPKSQ